MPRPFRVSTYFEPSDLLELEEAEDWTKAKAEAFLRQHEETIREAMASAGFEAIELLLEPRQTALVLD